MTRRLRSALLFLLVASCAGCAGGGSAPPPPDAHLPVGSWGGDGSAAIVSETQVHVHVHCTNGDFPAPVALDSSGRFSVSGSYVLRAFPIQIGPSLPAQLAGVVTGRRLTFSIAVNDTVEHKLVVLGPAILTLGQEPRLDACPICRRPALRNQDLVVK